MEVTKVQKIVVVGKVKQVLEVSWNQLKILLHMYSILQYYYWREEYRS